jgi:polyferredoxin
VLNLNQAAATGRSTSGECTNCGRCVPVCPEDSLSFDLRPLIGRTTRCPMITRRGEHHESALFFGIAIASLFGLGATHAGDQAIDPDRMGLSPVSVFEIPAPDVFGFPDVAPGEAGTLPRGLPGAPPQIPHGRPISPSRWTGTGAWAATMTSK